MAVLMIHQHPQLLEECCNLINREWPRSTTARMRSLLASCDNFPTCLVLIHDDQVVGHSKISAIPSIPAGCFVESVVIHPHLRGKGFGKLIMTKTEEFAKSQGMHTVYLSTHDQQCFYKKLGYTECPPVSIYGCAQPANGVTNYHYKTYSVWKKSATSPAPHPPQNIPTPPPPPPPPPPLPTGTSSTAPVKKTFMRKDLLPKNEIQQQNV